MSGVERCVRVSGSATSAPQVVELEAFELCVSCRASPQRDDPEDNEDALAVLRLADHAVLAVVADGVGGHGNGAAAARCVLDRLEAAFAEVPDALDFAAVGGRVLAALEGANDELVAATGSPAATVMVAAVMHDQLRTFHAGDAEALLVGQRGRLKLHIIKHGPAGHAEAAGVVDERGALEHPERHLITNMIGMQGMRVEVNSAVTMGARDTLVIGSDGLFDKLTRDAIAELVRVGPVDEAAVGLEQAVDARVAEDGHGDDCTFVLLRQRNP